MNGPLKYHGGKSYLAPWLHKLAPPSVLTDATNGYTHRCHPYAGGLGEFWNWEPIEGIAEAVNDASEELVNFYEVLRGSDSFPEFKHLVSLTPFSEHDFKRSPPNQPASVRCAVAFFTRFRQSRQGIGKSWATPTSRTRRGMDENVSAWLSAVDGLPECHERLQRVAIHCTDALMFIRRCDHKRAFFYCDPPYLFQTRQSTGQYDHEMSFDQHRDLLGTLSMIEGRFMLSGYRSELYDSVAEIHGWYRYEKQIDNKASGARTKPKQVEVCWTNYDAEPALPLFKNAA